MDVGKEEDKKWHEEHDMPQSNQEKAEAKSVNPFAVGGGFLDYCVKQNWLIQEGKSRHAKYFATQEGVEELKKFGINI
jgi:hypothetical protein